MKRILKFLIVIVWILVLPSCGPVTSTITHATIANPYSGAVNINLNGTPANSFTWTHGSNYVIGNSQNLSNQHSSEIPYSLTIGGNATIGGVSVPFTYAPIDNYVLCDVNWQTGNSNASHINLTTGSHGYIKKVGGGDGFNASGYSVNTLSAGKTGFVEFQVGSYGDFFIGLTPSYVSDAPTTIKYGLSFRRLLAISNATSSTYVYYVSAVDNTTGTSISIGKFVVGDIFQIRKTGNVISFVKNNSPLSAHITMSSAISSSNLIVDMSASTTNVGLTYVRTSFTDAFDYKNYATLTKELNSAYPIMFNTVNFKYQDKYYDPALKCTIYDWQRNVVYTSNISGVSNGINFESIPSNSLSSLQSGQLYILEVANSKNEVYKLKFQYKKN